MDEKPPDGQKSAQNNPWYCLATLYGAQSPAGFDPALAARNRIAWNRWMTGLVDAAQFDALLARGIAVSELQPFQESELEAFIATLEARLPADCAGLPGPDQFIDLSSTFFADPVSLAGFVFPSTVKFKNAHFAGRVNFHGAVFLGPAHFNGCVFASEAEFSGAGFHAPADFRGAGFSAPRAC